MSGPHDESAEVLVVRRVLPVERERVFAAWLDPVSLATWMRPGKTVEAIVEVDPRVGGRFRIVMQRRRRLRASRRVPGHRPAVAAVYTW